MLPLTVAKFPCTVPISIVGVHQIDCHSTTDTMVSLNERTSTEFLLTHLRSAYSTMRCYSLSVTSTIVVLPYVQRFTKIFKNT